MAISFVQRSYRDNSGEVSGFEIATYLVTGANLAAHEAHQTALDAAIADLTSGVLAKTAFGTRENVSSDLGPFGANREEKLLITYKGNTSEKLFRTELPCRDLVQANVIPNSDMLDLEDTEVAALIAAFEDLARSPDNGTEAVTVVSIRLVGRNI